MKSRARVTYTMYNHGPSKVINIGFPNIYDIKIAFDKKPEPAAIRNIVVKKNNRNIDYTVRREKNKQLINLFRSDVNGMFKLVFKDPGELKDEFIFHIAKFHFIVFKFKAYKKEQFTVTINYEIDNLKYKNISWSYMPNHYESPAIFQYILQTVNNWKRGSIGEFESVIELDKSINENNIIIPDTYTRKYKNYYQWKEKNFSPKRNISIAYYPEKLRYYFDKQARFNWCVVRNEDDTTCDINRELSALFEKLDNDISIKDFYSKHFHMYNVLQFRNTRRENWNCNCNLNK